MSMNGDVSGNHGYMDALIIKIDSSGNIEWQKCLGGSGDDGTYAIKPESDGGYVVAGWSSSADGDVSGGHGEDDLWAAKLNSEGKIQWQKCLGGSETENANSMVKTSDGGYAIAGFTVSSDGNVSGYHGGEDAWVVKLGSESSVYSRTSTSNNIFDLYPNPVTENEKISYVLDNYSSVKIDLINPLGEKIRAIVDNIEEPGFHEQNINIREFSSGSYFIKLVIDGISTVKFLELER
jgi:hypothetical protein